MTYHKVTLCVSVEMPIEVAVTGSVAKAKRLALQEFWMSAKDWIPHGRPVDAKVVDVVPVETMSELSNG